MKGIASFKHSKLVALAILLIIIAASAHFSVAIEESSQGKPKVISEGFKKPSSNEAGAVLQKALMPAKTVGGGAYCSPSGAVCQSSWGKEPLPCCSGSCGDSGYWTCYDAVALHDIPMLCYLSCP